MCNILLKLTKKFNSHIHYSFGDAEERAHIVFPASTFFEQLVVSRPGEDPPEMGSAFEEPRKLAQARKAYKAQIDWNTEDTYSMSFHSMYMDFPSWSIVNLPIGKDMNLHTFWGSSFLSFVLYEHDTSKEKHLISSNKYILSVQVSANASQEFHVLKVFALILPLLFAGEKCW